MTDSLCRKRKLADSFIPCGKEDGTNKWLSLIWFTVIKKFRPNVHGNGRLSNSVDPIQMPQKAASDQGLHYLRKKHSEFSV